MKQKRALPAFQTVSQDELRRIWKDYEQTQIRRLVLEVERYRRLIDDIELYRQSIDRAWKDEAGGSLVALYRLRLILKAERERLGILSEPHDK
ncbi:hypothetical protein SAMN04487926_15514 [Paraburkholderia steynii]|uniref:Uncharacterized protein n=1 Tax=Paraburkholderia steynii TaxID=1245441 RepID=A0A7Z7FQG1_9BURK|nr:hypothetical protein [Paraburkholderia steynii]SDJ49125.1 hypothetical protein SAMN04487926_15514 [Paraburkholderia steynii]